MRQSGRDCCCYSNDKLKDLLNGWFEYEDEKKKDELLRIIEIEILVGIEEQIYLINRVCRSHPEFTPEDFRIHVEKQVKYLAFERKHRDRDMPKGDAYKRLHDYWTDPEKHRLYPDISRQIRHIAWSIIREAITHHPIWRAYRKWSRFENTIGSDKSIQEGLDWEREPDWIMALYMSYINRDINTEEYLFIIETILQINQDQGFSQDEKKFISLVYGWDDDSSLTETKIEEKLGWYQSKANRVKKSIAGKIKNYLASN